MVQKQFGSAAILAAGGRDARAYGGLFHKNPWITDNCFDESCERCPVPQIGVANCRRLVLAATAEQPFEVQRSQSLEFQS
jgi:hypothetical protein